MAGNGDANFADGELFFLFFCFVKPGLAHFPWHVVDTRTEYELSPGCASPSPSLSL